MTTLYISRMNELESLSHQLTTVSLRPPTSSSHCRLEKGDIVGNYQIGAPLGKGRFATVWSAQKQTDGNCIAIKIYRMGGENVRYYANEVKILNRLLEFSLKTQTIPRNIVGYLGTFAHIAIDHDKSPRIHPCVLFNMEGDSLSKLVKFCKRQYGNGIPIPVVKKIMREVLTGLVYLHQCNIIHTDIKPSNILLNKKVEDLDESGLTISLADLGSSTFADDIFSETVGTTQYIAPELIIEMPFGTPMDIWASFAMCYELITGDLLFDVYGECDITYGEDVDGEAMEGLESPIETDPAATEWLPCDGTQCTESCNETPCEIEISGGMTYHEWVNSQSIDPDVIGFHTDYIEKRLQKIPALSTSSDSSGSEDDLDQEKLNYRHLLLIAKVIGNPPNEFARNARTYYNRRDRLKNNPDVSPTTISELLFSNYEMDPEECKKIEDFLLQGLKYLPEERITAEQALQHPFLQ